MPDEEKNSGRESRHCYLVVKVLERSAGVLGYWTLDVLHTQDMDRQQLNILHVLKRRWSNGHPYSSELGKQAYNAAYRVDFFLCAHLIYKAGLEAGDYHGQMNATNFEKWEAKKLTSNFPPQPVIVLDNSPYQWLQVDRPLSTCIVKTGMIWLCRKGIVSDETMSKNDLPIKSSTEAQRDINKIDRILANQGHEVRLPPYMWPKLTELT